MSKTIYHTVDIEVPDYEVELDLDDILSGVDMDDIMEASDYTTSDWVEAVIDAATPDAVLKALAENFTAAEIGEKLVEYGQCNVALVEPEVTFTPRVGDCVWKVEAGGTEVGFTVETGRDAFVRVFADDAEFDSGLIRCDNARQARLIAVAITRYKATKEPT